MAHGLPAVAAVGLVILSSIILPSEAHHIIEIATFVTRRRPQPVVFLITERTPVVPEYIRIAELANRRKHSTSQPTGDPDFLKIAESFHAGGGGGHRVPPPVSPSPPRASTANLQPEELPVRSSQSSKQKDKKKEEFNEDKIYFEEWDPK